jgi:muramidase (phage lysozyme)
LKNLREQEAALTNVLRSNPNAVLQGRLKEVRAEMAQVLGEQSDLISRATSEENRRSLSEFQLMLNDRMSSLQGAYNREQNEIWERYNAEVKAAQLAGQSIHEIENKKDNDVLASRKRLFEETLKLYQDQLMWEQSLATYGTEGEQRRAEARINELQDRIAKLRDDYQTAVGLGINKVSGADDAKNKLEKGVTNLNNMRDKIAKLGAEIRGANPDLAELQEMLDRREFGPMGAPEVQHLVDKTREAIAELEKLEKIRDGQKKAEQDLKRIKERNIEDEFDLIERRSGKTLTESERFVMKIQRGFYPGMGPRSEIEKLLDGVSGGFDKAGSKANQFGDVARENAFGPQVVDSINSVNEALRTTGVIIGSLANGLSSLDISAALSLKNGFGGDKLLPGGALRGRAGSFLDLIGLAEGTDKGRGYNETLGFGALTGGDVDLINMTLDEIDKLQTMMLKNPANKWNSSAVGRYQIVQQTLRGLREELGLTGDMKFDPQLQDILATTLMKRRGNDPAALRNEWEGLRRVDDGAIRSSYAGSPVNVGGPRISALPVYDPAKEAEIEAAVSRTNKVIQEAEAETLKARQIQNGNFEEDRKDLLKQYKAHALDASKGVEVADNNYKKLLDTIREGKLGLSKDINAEEYKKLIAAAKELDALAEKTKKTNKARDEASRMGADLERQRIELVRETADAYKAVNDPLEKGTSRALDAMSRKWDEYLLKVERGYTRDSAQYRQALVDKQTALGQQLALESGQVAAKWTKENQTGRIALMTQSQARRATMEREIATIDAALARFVGTEEEKVQAVAVAEERKAQIRAQYAQESDPLTKQFKEWADFQENLAKQSAQWVNSLADGLTGLITGTGDLRSMISGVFKDMVNMNVKWLMGTIGNKGSEAGGAMAKLNAGLRNGGGAKKLGAPIAHTGGIIGRSSLASRIVGSHIFSGAPRFHTGGIVGRDEVPIIAKKGEGVFTPEQMQSLGGWSQSNFQISAPITVNGSAGTPAQNDDLAKKMAREMEATMRGVVADEFRKARRPGNMANSRGY